MHIRVLVQGPMERMEEKTDMRLRKKAESRSFRAM